MSCQGLVITKGERRMDDATVFWRLAGYEDVNDAD
jgi:hypothetical protein